MSCVCVFCACMCACRQDRARTRELIKSGHDINFGFQEVKFLETGHVQLGPGSTRPIMCFSVGNGTKKFKLNSLFISNLSPGLTIAIEAIVRRSKQILFWFNDVRNVLYVRTPPPGGDPPTAACCDLYHPLPPRGTHPPLDSCFELPLGWGCSTKRGTQHRRIL